MEPTKDSVKVSSQSSERIQRQRIQDLYYLLNMVGKSGFVDTKVIIKEILRLEGLSEAFRESVYYEK